VIAAKTLCQVAAGGSLSDVLAKALPDVAPKDRALVQELCYGVLRWWLRLQWIAQQLLERPIKSKDRDLEMLILIGFYQLLYMRIPSHAAVAETVEGAKSLGKPWAKGLINGVLRNLMRNQDELLDAISNDTSAELSCPQWLLEEIKKAWPQKWREILTAANDRPPMSLRVNLKRCSRAEYAEKLLAESVAAKPIPHVSTGLVLDRAQDVFDLPGFKDGLVSVQDGGAQFAAELMDLEPGQKVLDLCAAPGGKTCHILEIAPDGVSITAVDISSKRLQRVQENLDRLSLEAKLHTGDAAQPSGEWAEQDYDRILLDVPCSATGVIRRHPDIKLLRRSEDIAALAKLQQKIIQSAWSLLKPGGVLLYVTCSLLPQENEEQIDNFLSNTSDAAELPVEGPWGHARSFGRQTLPGEESMDGFFYARLQKQS
jgi:16S rRNA (cytosine967-C5)-methyltransferase